MSDTFNNSHDNIILQSQQRDFVVRHCTEVPDGKAVNENLLRLCQFSFIGRCILRLSTSHPLCLSVFMSVSVLKCECVTWLSSHFIPSVCLSDFGGELFYMSICLPLSVCVYDEERPTKSQTTTEEARDRDEGRTPADRGEGWTPADGA